MTIIRQWGVIALLGAVLRESRAFPELIDPVNYRITRHWDSVFQALQMRFSRTTPQIFTIHRIGEIRVYESIDSDVDDYRVILDIKDRTYSYWDKGLLSFDFHPDFPEVPYGFGNLANEKEPEPWNDECPVNETKAHLTDPPDNRNFCGNEFR